MSLNDGVLLTSSIETERIIEVEYTWGMTSQSFWLRPDAGDTYTPGHGVYTEDPSRITDDLLHISGGEITVPRGWNYRAVRQIQKEVRKKQTTPA